MNLRGLREMGVVTVEGIARTLRVPESWIGTIESAPLDTVPLGTVRRYVEALGCRLDVVAQHIDGVAHWLTVPCSHEGIGLPGCTTCDPSTGPRAGASRRAKGPTGGSFGVLLKRLGIHGPARDELLESVERGAHQSGIVIRQADDARKRAEARIDNAIDALTSARMVMSVGDPAASWVEQALRALRGDK